MKKNYSNDFGIHKSPGLRGLVSRAHLRERVPKNVLDGLHGVSNNERKPCLKNEAYKTGKGPKFDGRSQVSQVGNIFRL